jgi:hypothetical protein
MEPVPGVHLLLPIHHKNSPATSSQAKVIRKVIGSPKGKQGTAILKTIVFKAQLQLSVQIQLARNLLIQFQFPPGLKILNLALQIGSSNKKQKNTTYGI